MELKVKGQKIKLNDKICFCHGLTATILWQLKDLSEKGVQLKASVNPDMDTVEFTRAVRDINKIPFSQKDCANLPIGSVIFFYTKDDTLQHTMFVYEQDAWVGANNTGSLGANTNYPACYERMSKREYQCRGQGGWISDFGTMHSVYGDEYEMYYIPVMN